MHEVKKVVKSGHVNRKKTVARRLQQALLRSGKTVYAKKCGRRRERHSFINNGVPLPPMYTSRMLRLKNDIQNRSLNIEQEVSQSGCLSIA